MRRESYKSLKASDWNQWHWLCKPQFKPLTMDIESIDQTKQEFQILQTRHHSQTAVIRLDPGKATGKDKQDHSHSEQVVLVLQGEFLAEVGDETRTVTIGESLIIPAGVKHRLSNPGGEPALAYTVYAPPVYPPALPRS